MTLGADGAPGGEGVDADIAHGQAVVANQAPRRRSRARPAASAPPTPE